MKIERKKLFRRIAIDFTSAFFGVLIAILLGNMQETYKEKVYIEKCFNNIYNENQENIKSLVYANNQYKKFIDTLNFYIDIDTLSIAEILENRNLDVLIFLKQSGWRTLNESEVKVNVDFDLLQGHTQIDDIFNFVKDFENKILNHIYQKGDSKQSFDKVVLLSQLETAYSAINALRQGYFELNKEIKEKYDIQGIKEIVRNSKSNIARSKKVEASSSQDEGFLAKYAFDGDRETRWSSLWRDSQWISVDLEKVENIKRIVLDWEAAYALEYDIAVSSDGDNWSKVFSQQFSMGEVEQVDVDTTARYIKLECNKRASMYGVSLYEFEVYREE